MRIVLAANVLAPAYRTIVEKGYALRKEGALLVATKGADTFLADDPIRLLGIIVVGEVRGETWQPTNEEIAEFLEFDS